MNKMLKFIGYIFGSLWVVHLLLSGPIDRIDFGGDSFTFFAISTASFVYMLVSIIVRVMSVKRASRSTAAEVTTTESSVATRKQTNLKRVNKNLIISFLVALVGIPVIGSLVGGDDAETFGLWAIACVLLLIAIVTTSSMVVGEKMKQGKK